jgi:hypothetical protein
LSGHGAGSVISSRFREADAQSFDTKRGKTTKTTKTTKAPVGCGVRATLGVFVSLVSLVVLASG